MEYRFKTSDFEHPTMLFRLEDRLKAGIGGVFYNPIIDSYDIRGDENILDFGCGAGWAAGRSAKN